MDEKVKDELIEHLAARLDQLTVEVAFAETQIAETRLAMQTLTDRTDQLERDVVDLQRHKRTPRWAHLLPWGDCRN